MVEIGLIVILCIVAIYIMYGDNTREVAVTPHDKFQVIGDYPDHTDAARLMSDVNNDVINFLRYLKQKYLVVRRRSDGTIIRIGDLMDGDSPAEYEQVYPERIVNIVKRMVKKYNPQTVVENRPGSSKETSYTVDKGRRMHICLRDKTTHRLHSRNTVLFVTLHELSHIGNEGWGHGVHDFWPTFKFLLAEADTFGILPAVDYSKHPEMYCGLDIRYSPLFDPGLPDWRPAVSPQ